MVDIKDIYNDKKGAVYLKDILHSQIQKSNEAVLIYKHKKKNEQTPQRNISTNESIIENGQIDSPAVFSEEQDSIEGSPLKLQRFDMECHLVKGGQGDFQAVEHQVKIPGKPLDVTQARYLLSNKGKDYDNLPVWVYCDGLDPQGIMLLGSYSQIPDNKDTVVVHTYKVTSKGPFINKEQFPKISCITSKHFQHIAKVKTRCFAEYNVLEAQSRDVSMLQHQGMLKIKLEWDKALCLLQNPPLDSKTTVELSVSEGDMRSAAYNMYTELITLQGFAHGLKEGFVEWAVENEDLPMIPKLKRLLDDLKQGDYRKKSVEDEEAQSPLKSLIFGRKDLDFTEQLWNVLKDCSCYKDLVAGLDLVFSYLQNGQLQPMVHKSNKSRLAQLVRDSYYGKMIMPSSEGLLPLQILVEIGTEKLQRDYTNAFIGRDLVTASHLEYFLKTGDTYDDKINRLVKLHSALEVSVMLEQYLDLPRATLSMSARQALKHYEHNSVEEGHVFCVPVQTNCIADKIERCQASLWKVDMYGTVDQHEICTSYILTTRPVYNHAHRQISVSSDLEEDSLHYYLTTESENIVVL